jgi:uncharacterized protein (DUF433 family)
VQLEDYFDFEKLDSKHGPVERIRVKGSRIAIEVVIAAWKEGATPEHMADNYRPSLNLEQVYATITYYLHNRDAVEDYIRRGEGVADAYYQEYQQQGPYFLRDEALKPVAGQPAGGKGGDAGG